MRWNENRGRAAVEGAQRSALRTYDAQLQHSFDQLTQRFCKRTLVENYTQPREYTGELSPATPLVHAVALCLLSLHALSVCAGELIGVEYLYSQTGSVLQPDLGDPDAPGGTDEAEEVDGDEGFQEDEEPVPEEIRLLELVYPLLEAREPIGVPAAEASVSQSGSDHTPPSRDDGGSRNGGDPGPGMEVQQAEGEDDVSTRSAYCGGGVPERVS